MTKLEGMAPAMAEDPLLKALTDTAREIDPVADPRWEALAEGTLAADEEAALAALAASDARARELYEAFRPLDAAARARIAGKLITMGPQAAPNPASPSSTLITMGPQAAPNPASPSSTLITSSPDAARPSSLRARPPAKVSPLRRFGWALAAAAMLAGGVLVLTAPPRGDAALPRYALAVSAGEREVRALPQEVVDPPRLGPGSRLALVLRPATEVSGPVAARAFLLRDGRARAWEVPIEVASTGAVRIEGTREALFAGLPAGRVEVLVAVARPSALPSADELVAASAREGCQIVRQAIILAEGAAGP